MKKRVKVGNPLKTMTRRKVILIIYASILTLGVSYFILWQVFDMGLECSLYEIAGIRCPACGSSRMFLSMLKLDFVQAFSYNQNAFFWFWFWNITALLNFIGKPKFVTSFKYLITMLYIYVGSTVIFGAVRVFVDISHIL